MPVERVHAASLEQVATLLGTDLARGLADSEVNARRARHGLNRLQSTRAPSPGKILARQFLNVLVVVLILAGVASAALGDLGDALAIFAIVVLNAAMGFVQEFRAERALAALRSIAAPTAQVMRAQIWREIRAQELVPGDIVRLAAGDLVPADMRLVESHLLRNDESALSGESEPVDKIADALADRPTPLPDQRNMVFLGTSVVHGRGVGAVAATGDRTELGKIARLVARTERSETPLQLDLARLGRGLVTEIGKWLEPKLRRSLR